MKLIPLTLSVAAFAWLPLAAGAEERPGFRYGGQVFQEEALPPALRQQLFNLEFALNRDREQLLTQFAIEKYITDRAEAEGKTIEEVQNEIIAPSPPDEASLRALYEENKDRIPATFEDARGQLAKYLQEKQVQDGLSALVEAIRKEKGFEVILPELEAPAFEVATEGYPSKGAQNPDITVVEFADYQCPYCKMAISAVDSLLEEYGDRVRVVYRDFPINSSGISEEVALGGVCAAEQGQFWEYHDLAFETQESLDKDSPQEIASEIGLDEQAFADCITSDETQARVEQSKAEAMKLGISGTPTFFVNGRQLQVSQELERDLATAVEKALSGSR